MNLFVYGTLKEPLYLEALIGRIPDMIPAVLKNHQVYGDTDGYFFLAEAVQEQVAGMVLHITNQELAVLDMWEDVPLYTRKNVVVDIGKHQTMAAQTYFKSDFKEMIPVSSEASSLMSESEVLAEIKAFKDQINMKKH